MTLESMSLREAGMLIFSMKEAALPFEIDWAALLASADDAALSSRRRASKLVLSR